MNNAVWCVLLGIHPIVQSKVVMSVINMLMINLLIYQIGKSFFRGDEKKADLMVLFVCLMQLFSFSIYCKIISIQTKEERGMFCPHCGQNNPPDSLFCTYCGACLNYDDNNSFQPTPPMNPYTPPQAPYPPYQYPQPLRHRWICAFSGIRLSSMVWIRLRAFGRNFIRRRYFTEYPAGSGRQRLWDRRRYRQLLCTLFLCFGHYSRGHRHKRFHIGY